MNAGDPLELAARFHAAINAGSLADLGALVSEDHRFIDSAGAEVSGKAAALDAWRAFFALFPDYRNHPRESRQRGSTGAMAGECRCSDPRLDGAALWRVQVQGGLIAEWQVYADTPENRRSLGFD